jgi:hypothetical protein
MVCFHHSRIRSPVWIDVLSFIEWPVFGEHARRNVVVGVSDPTTAALEHGESEDREGDCGD